VDLNAGGEISDRKIGTIPNTLRSDLRTRASREVSHENLPLNAKLDAESTGGELAECAREDPEGNKHPNDDDENTVGNESVITFKQGNAHIIVRRRPRC
jgi:hypothetical protein